MAHCLKHKFADVFVLNERKVDPWKWMNMKNKLPMITTGTVGGCSCGSVVSSSRGMAKACARAGTTEERQQCGYSSRHYCSQIFDVLLQAET